MAAELDGQHEREGDRNWRDDRKDELRKEGREEEALSVYRWKEGDEVSRVDQAKHGEHLVVRLRIGDVICVLNVRDDLVECDDNLELGAIVANDFMSFLQSPNTRLVMRMQEPPALANRNCSKPQQEHRNHNRDDGGNQSGGRIADSHREPLESPTKNRLGDSWNLSAKAAVRAFEKARRAHRVARVNELAAGACRLCTSP